MTDRGPLADPELELRAHLAGVNFATQTLLRLVDDLFRRTSGYSPDWEVVATNLESLATAGEDPFTAVNRRGRQIAAQFMRETGQWSLHNGSPGPEPRPAADAPS